MKRLWYATAILTVTFLLCVGTQLYQHKQIDQLLYKLEQLESVYAANPEAATAVAEEFAQRYRQVARVMNCYISHNDLAESEETAALLPALVKAGQGDELAMELARLREELTFLRSVDDPLLQNIL